MPPPPRRVPPPARVLTPPAPTPTGNPKGAVMVNEAGRPSIRLVSSDNAWSILAMTRRAMKDAGCSEAEIGTATDALLKAPSGTSADVAARYVEVTRG